MDEIRSSQNSVLWLALAVNSEMQSAVLDCTSEEQIDERKVCSIVETASHNISAKCFGLLELRHNSTRVKEHELRSKLIESATMTSVGFIHRTAVDFLANTDFGKSLGGSNTTPAPQNEMDLLRAYLCVSRIITWSHSQSSVYPGRYEMQNMNEWLNILSQREHCHNLLPLTGNLYDEDALSFFRGPEICSPQPLFLVVLTKLPVFHHFVIDCLSTRRDTQLATRVLREMWYWRFHTLHPWNAPIFASLTRKLLQVGADALSAGAAFPKFLGKDLLPLLLPYGSPLGLFLGFAADFLSGSLRAKFVPMAAHRYKAEIIRRLAHAFIENHSIAALSTHRIRRTLLWSERVTSCGSWILRNAGEENSPYRSESCTHSHFDNVGIRTAQPHLLILDTNLAFFTAYVLRLTACIMNTAEETVEESFWTRFNLTPEMGQSLENALQEPPTVCYLLRWPRSGPAKCYKPLEQDSMARYVSMLMPGMAGNLEGWLNDEPVDDIIAVSKDPRLCEEIDWSAFLTGLLDENIEFTY
jgi:hypothetical protein